MKIKIKLYDKNTIGINVVCMLADLLCIFFLEKSLIVSFLLLMFSIVFDIEARKRIKKREYN